ncbi:MAG: sensor histidine kinase [Chitinophagaceae bacterium]|nr:sensor histidine kinase [Chitinophagaceae bacterium]
MSGWIIILVCVLYLLLLFFIATWAEQRKKAGKSLINNGWAYALSMAVYCTAWTFYGSVGRAASGGIAFLTVYIGPTIMAALFWPVLRKMLRISSTMRLTSLADFISTRYGKNFSVAVIVSLFAVAGLIPYIGLQLKSIINSFEILAGNAAQHNSSFIAIGVTLILTVFTILYGARSVDTAEKHEGLISVIAFESIVKLLAFLLIGVFTTFFLFDGFADVFRRMAAQAQSERLFTISGTHGMYEWVSLTILSGLALLLLPRQFQVSVVENIHENHIRKASWLFPAYLIAINLFVLPIAFGGHLLFGGQALVNADNYVLAIPLQQGKPLLATFTWLGGFAAATGMIVVETIALSIMISNNLVMPLLVKKVQSERQADPSFQPRILLIRRIVIGVVLLIALLYSKTAGQRLSLVSIGFISFCAVAQFAPAVLGGMFWKEGNKKGAIAGMIAGFLIWGYTLVLPGIMPDAVFVQQGPWGLHWLRPYTLFGLDGFDPIAHAFTWSMLVNVLLYIGVSIHTKAGAQEQYQAELFVDVFKHGRNQQGVQPWQGQSSVAELQQLLGTFIGTDRSTNLLQGYAQRQGIAVHPQQPADGRLVAFTERILGGIIGTASARILIGSSTKEEEINLEEVLNILRENQQTIETNKELRKRSAELSKATRQLEAANAQLQALDQLKDEFLYTVTHELRTPLTSVRALSEILHDNPDLDEAQRQHYLAAITKETERLSHLITQVLTLEKFESGRYRPHLSATNLAQLLTEAVEALRPLAAEKQLSIHLRMADTQVLVQADRDLLLQVLYNLLGNAIKFAHQHIEVQLVAGVSEWQVWVKDDGRGVPADEQAFIFDKFFQARHQTLKKPEGSGLGLAICKKIIELHGGDIIVESQEGHGAAFVFSIPAS